MKKEVKEQLGNKEGNDRSNIKSKRIRSGILGFNIRTRLIGSYCILVMFIILVGVLSYKNAAKAMIDNYESSTMQTLDMQGEYLEYGFETVKSTAVELLVDQELILYLSGELQGDQVKHQEYYSDEKTLIINKADSNKFIKNIYLFSDADYSISTNKKSTLNMFTEYIKTKQGASILQDQNQYYWYGDKTVIDDTLNVNSDDYAVRVVKAFYNQKAFLAIDVDRQIVLDVLNKINPGRESKIAFVTTDGLELRADGSREELFSGAEFYTNAQNSDSTIQCVDDVSYLGVNYMFLFRKISNTGSMVCVLVPKSTVLDQVAGIKYVAFVVIIIATVLAVLIGTGITVNVSKSIHHMIRNIKQIAEGDVSVRLDDRKKDEFGRLAVHMNVMLENITILLKHAKNVSKQISVSAVEVKESSGLFSDSSIGISNAMLEIREGLTKQAEDTVSSVELMEELAGKIERVDEETYKIRKIADSTEAAIEDSSRELIILNDKARETTDVTQSIIRIIEELNLKSKRIDEIINVMKEIANETELLSLNASIEAARSGEAGKGFGVVAEEIKKLSAQSQSSSKEIKKIVKDISDTAAKAIQTAAVAGDIINAQEETVIHTQQSFLIMKQQAGELLQNVSVIEQRVRQMQKEKEISVCNMENISAVTEEVVASVYTVNENAQSQVGKIQVLTNLSKMMIEQSQQLEQAMARFTI